MRLKAPITKRRLTGRAVALGLFTTLGVAGLWAVAIGQEADPPYESSGRVAQAVQEDQAAEFVVFDRPRTSGDEMPREARRQVGNSTRTGRNLDLSRAIRTPTGRGWAIPGDGTICIVVPDPVDGYGVGCVPTDQAARQGAWLIMGPPDGGLELTLLTPRSSRVTARRRDGSERTLQADSDGVVSEVLSEIAEIDVSTRSGVETLPMPVPIDGPTEPSG